jgi:D-alanine--poly(phosphoribitol) ligase subunit 2
MLLSYPVLKLKGEIIMENLIKILEGLHPDVDFRTCDTLIDEQVLDSFDIISLIAEIDTEFDVTIPAEEIIPENFNSAKALYALIERLSDED